MKKASAFIKDEKPLPLMVSAGDGEYHGAITNGNGIIYDELALKTLLAACVFGKLVIKRYPYKTSYNFLVGRKRGWSNKKIERATKEVTA